jgi:sigma-B regulation protein RsbU (phosphoserine phosphatase)
MNDTETSKELLVLKKEVSHLKIAVQELSILNEIASAISSTLNVNRIIELIVQKCIKHLNVEQCAVMLLDKQDKQSPFHTMIRKAAETQINMPLRLDTQLTGWMIQYQKPLVINNFKNEKRFFVEKSDDFPIQTLLCVPLLAKGEIIGLISLFNKKETETFSKDDERLLSIIAAQSAGIIENARLYEEEKALLQMQEEMRMAHEIQANLLPQQAPVLEGYDIAGISLPAKDVGGDYFDFIKIDQSNLAFCLGDVSGKGMPAALLMANLQATIRGQALLKNSPKECMEKSNKLLFHCTDDKKFATVFYGILNSLEHKIIYSNAGHNNPYLFKKNSDPIPLEAGGLLLSFMEEISYDEGVVEFVPDDLLLIYSDGVTEAMDDNEIEFGDEKLISLVQEHYNDGVDKIISKIVKAVNIHACKQPQMDDITLLIIKRLE